MEFIINLTPTQVKNLKTGKNIQLSYKQLQTKDGHKIRMTINKQHYHKLIMNVKNKKGYKFNNEHIEGCGIYDNIKNIWETIKTKGKELLNGKTEEPRETTTPQNDNDLQLYDVLKNSYAKEKQQKLGNYNYDEDLSTVEHQVYHNPENNKLLFSVTGTNKKEDIPTDIMASLGKIKDTPRYRRTKDALEEAKNKYNTDNAIIAGHSLGNSLASLIGSKDDRIYGLNKGAFFQKPQKNEKHFRINGDLVSLASKSDNNTTTLKSKNKKTGNVLNDLLNSHKINNIKNYDIRLI